jgi:hypothetical protein
MKGLSGNPERKGSSSSKRGQPLFVHGVKTVRVHVDGMVRERLIQVR